MFNIRIFSVLSLTPFCIYSAALKIMWAKCWRLKVQFWKISCHLKSQSHGIGLTKLLLPQKNKKHFSIYNIYNILLYFTVHSTFYFHEISQMWHKLGRKVSVYQSSWFIYLFIFCKTTNWLAKALKRYFTFKLFFLVYFCLYLSSRERHKLLKLGTILLLAL